MKVSYNWLKDFVSIKGAVDSLCHKLTMAGLEVTDYRKIGQDWVLDIEVTPNRSDCLSHLGIAREIAAITGRKLASYRVSELPRLNAQRRKRPTGVLSEVEGRANAITIKIENKKDCPLYTARIIDNLRIKKSDTKLAGRLAIVGLRSVNNIVDITNYVLLEIGQPLHAFDLDKIINRSKNAVEIVVRRAKKGEEITTIDGQVRRLSSDILVIADKSGPIAIAGVMGGKDCEVDSTTKRILLESAYFNPITVRHSRQKLGLITESSYRFEREAILSTVLQAQKRASDLIKEVLPQSNIRRIYTTGSLRPKKTSLILDISSVNKLLGTHLAKGQILRILKSLGFNVRARGNLQLKVDVPDFRKDIKSQEDIIEEIARIYGYDNIPIHLPKISVQAKAPESTILEECNKIIKHTLCASGFFEVITYSLRSEDKAKALLDESRGLVAIANPLSKEQALLRPSLSCGLLDVAAHNFNRLEDEVNIFEMGTVFTYKNGNVSQRASLGILASGERISDWYRRAPLKERIEITFFDLKGVIETLFSNLGVDNTKVEFRRLNSALYEKENCAAIIIGGSSIGSFGKIAANILGMWEIRKQDIFISLIDLQELFAFVDLKKSFKEISAFPQVFRDISFIAKEEIPVKEIKDAILNKAIPILKEEITLFDEYKGANVPKGLRSLSFSLKFAASGRTLKEEEINSAINEVKDLLLERFSVKFR